MITHSPVRNSNTQSFDFIVNDFLAKKIIKIQGIINRKNPRVKRGILSSDHLKIGGAAPQIVLAIISAKIALLDLDSFMIIVISKE